MLSTQELSQVRVYVKTMGTRRVGQKKTGLGVPTATRTQARIVVAFPPLLSAGGSTRNRRRNLLCSGREVPQLEHAIFEARSKGLAIWTNRYGTDSTDCREAMEFPARGTVPDHRLASVNGYKTLTIRTGRQ